jgi:hypothetical protein
LVRARWDKGIQTIPSVGNLPREGIVIRPELLADDHATETLVKTPRARVRFEHPQTQGLEAARPQCIGKRGHQAASAAEPLRRAQHVDRIDFRVVRQ